MRLPARSPLTTTNHWADVLVARPRHDMAIRADCPTGQQLAGGCGHSRGPEGAVVTLVEYGDYHSAACEQAHALILHAQERLGSRLRFTFRHFVSAPARANSEHAAEAAEAASAQGRFWEMHNLLFARHGALDDGHLVEYADALGLDTTRFLRDMAGHTYADGVREQRRGGVANGVDASPTFFINGIRLKGEWSEHTFLEALDKAGASKD